MTETLHEKIQQILETYPNGPFNEIVFGATLVDLGRLFGLGTRTLGLDTRRVGFDPVYDRIELVGAGYVVIHKDVDRSTWILDRTGYEWIKSVHSMTQFSDKMFELKVDAFGMLICEGMVELSEDDESVGTAVDEETVMEDDEKKMLTITWRPQYDGMNATEVVVAGSWNDWNEPTPLVRIASAQSTDMDRWECSVNVSRWISKNDYEFKFIVDGRWETSVEYGVKEAFLADGTSVWNNLVLIE